MNSNQYFTDSDARALSQAAWLIGCHDKTPAPCGACGTEIADVSDVRGVHSGAPQGRNVLFTHICPKCAQQRFHYDPQQQGWSVTRHAAGVRATPLFDDNEPLLPQVARLMNTGLRAGIAVRGVTHGARRLTHLEASFLPPGMAESWAVVSKASEPRLLLAPYAWREDEEDFALTTHAAESWALGLIRERNAAAVAVVRGVPIVTASKEDSALIEREVAEMRAAAVAANRRSKEKQ